MNVRISGFMKGELLLDNENAPLLNRTIQGAYTPGSTFKPVTAIAGLEEGVITKDTIIYDRGVSIIGGWKFRCLEHRMGLGAHGSLDLKKAVATSCNIYFHELGARVGIDKIDKWLPWNVLEKHNTDRRNQHSLCVLP